MHEFQRVGFHADPLGVSLEYQDGRGRFDDPEQARTVLYAADSVRTCIYEVALPWEPGDDGYVYEIVDSAEAEDADDAELAEAIRRDAEHDREVATRRRQLPQTLYEKAKVHATLDPPAQLVDLNEVGVRKRLADLIPQVLFEMTRFGLRQLDKSVLLGRHTTITRALSGYLMRSEFDGERHDGLAADSRHHGLNYVLFEGRYRIGSSSEPVRLTPDDPDVLAVAEELGWDR